MLELIQLKFRQLYHAEGVNFITNRPQPPGPPSTPVPPYSPTPGPPGRVLCTVLSLFHEQDDLDLSNSILLTKTNRKQFRGKEITHLSLMLVFD